ncbi:cytochrome P450 [Streptomyces sp. NPDC000618]|uniref:cytochrome P450 n=1 Tax=Streptomyces sp. NPDC000618 TaxID=3154265 RepID=UPI00332A2E7E
MTEVPAGARPLPTTRTTPLDPPPELLERQQQCPVDRLRYPDGSEGWLITGYDQVRAALADPRFSSQKYLLRSPIQPQEPTPAAPGFFVYTDPPEHTKYRRLLTGLFTLRRMSQLAERVKEIATDALDAMEEAGPPVDLVPAFALALPSLVICELLGVPYEDREVFQHNSTVIQDINTPLDQAYAALDAMQKYLSGLVERRRGPDPSEDILGGLAAHEELTVEEVTNICFLLLAAGHETTANMLSLGTYALLTNPDQLAMLRSGETTMDSAVEELMRYLTVNHYGPIRGILEDFEFEGCPMKAGETVTLSAFAANRDPKHFADPDQLDFARGGRGQLSFGHGIHQCIGQQLARIEMRIGFQALLDRFPELRLAVPKEEVRMRDTMLIYGVSSMPVAW